MNSVTELFHGLECLEYAMQASVVDPVTIPSDFGHGNVGGLRARGTFSAIYYDCEDHGPGIMRARIQRDEQQIRDFMAVHQQIQPIMYQIEELTALDEREAIYSMVLELGLRLANLGEIIREHQKRHPEEVFLFWPSAIPGHYGIRGQEVLHIEFNPEQTEEGYFLELEKLPAIASVVRDTFSIRQPLRIITGGSDDRVSMDGSYRGNLARTIQLLEHAGLKI